MSFVPDTQQGATIAFSGVTLGVEPEEIGSAVDENTPIAIPHLGTTGQVPYIPGDLNDVQPFTVRFQNDGNGARPARGTVYTVTITAPLMSGDATAESWAGTAIVQSVSTPAFTANANALQTFDVTVKPDGGGTGTGSAWARSAAT